MKLRKPKPMAMPRRYTTLRKKLRELEAKVVELLTLPPETPHHDLLSDGVEQRLESLKALVAAEMASLRQSPPPTHLLHVTEKLSELEMAFREWDHCCRAAAVGGAGDDCSCGGESSLNDGGDDDGDINMADLGFKVYDVPKELRMEDDGEEVEEEEERSPDEKTQHLVRPPYNGGGEEAAAVVSDAGKYYRVWATGAVLGAFSMAVFMARFSACFYVVEYIGPLTPT